ncbi:MAG: response regulator transcription factor [Dokdonella sp.]|jgi:DNA-binding NarL/FixJ family response regulator|nr:response regulator transcription factor [Dokdonella sp.]
MSRYAQALVVDDLPASRAWLGDALTRAFPGIALAMAGSLAEAAPHLATPPPLALIDLGLPDGSGVTLIGPLQAAGSLAVVATVFDDDAHLFPALAAGAAGYVLKDQPPDALATMLRGIADGQPPLSPSIARRLLGHFRPAPAAADAALTARETDVLRLIAKGLTVADVAAALALSRHTVTGYVKDVYRKLRVSTRAEATLEATRRGLVGGDTY